MPNESIYKYPSYVKGRTILALILALLLIALAKPLVNWLFHYNLFGLTTVAVYLCFTVLVWLVLNTISIDEKYLALGDSQLRIVYFSFRKDYVVDLAALESVHIIGSPGIDEPVVYELRLRSGEKRQFGSEGLPVEAFTHYLNLHQIRIDHTIAPGE